MSSSLVRVGKLSFDESRRELSILLGNTQYDVGDIIKVSSYEEIAQINILNKFYLLPTGNLYYRKNSPQSSSVQISATIDGKDKFRFYTENGSVKIEFTHIDFQQPTNVKVNDTSWTNLSTPFVLSGYNSSTINGCELVSGRGTAYIESDSLIIYDPQGSVDNYVVNVLLESSSSSQIPKNFLVFDASSAHDTESSSQYVKVSQLAPVAFSGNYADLIGKIIYLSELSDDSTHRLVTDSEKSTWNSKQNAITSSNKLSAELISGLPTNLSQFNDDSTHRLVTDSEKSTWNSKQNAINGSNKLPAEHVSGLPTNLSQFNDDSTHRLVTDTEKSTWNSKQDEINAGNKLSADYVSGLPTELSQFNEDSTHRLVTDVEKSTWNNKQDKITSSNKLPYSLLSGTPSIPSKVTDLSDGSDYAKVSELADVAISNSYNDLDDKPVIPTKHKVVSIVKVRFDGDSLHLHMEVSKSPSFNTLLTTIDTQNSSSVRSQIKVYDGTNFVEFPANGVGVNYDGYPVIITIPELDDDIAYIRYYWKSVTNNTNSDTYALVYPTYSEVSPLITSYEDLTDKPSIPYDSRLLTLIKIKSNDELYFKLEVSSTPDFGVIDTTINTYTNSSDRSLVKVFDGFEWVNFPSSGGLGPVFDNLPILVNVNSLSTDKIHYIRYSWISVIINESNQEETSESDYWSFAYPSQVEINPPFNLSSGLGLMTDEYGDLVIDPNYINTLVNSRSINVQLESTSFAPSNGCIYSYELESGELFSFTSPIDNSNLVFRLQLITPNSGVSVSFNNIAWDESSPTFDSTNSLYILEFEWNSIVNKWLGKLTRNPIAIN